MHLFFLSIFVGWGVAMPIGPINIEMMRRNLSDGFAYGIALGIGATSADVTYLLLLVSGALVLLHQQLLLQVFSIIGAIILLWFAWQALSMPAKQADSYRPHLSILRCIRNGYFIAIFSPFNLLFWLSLTSQMAALTQGQHFSLLLSGLGIIIGAMSWVISLNLLIHFTRHRLSNNVVAWLNRIGGIILIGFAIYSVIHVCLL